VGQNRLRFRPALLSHRRPLLHPDDVPVIGRRDIERNVLSLFELGHGSRILPSLDFRVSIREGESPRAIVITCGVINDRGAVRLGGKPGHVHTETTIVDTVLTLVEHHEDTRRAGIGHVRDLGQDAKLLIAGRGPGVAKPVVHRHGSDARVPGAADGDGTLIRGALPDCGRVTTVRPEEAVLDVLVHVPIASVGRAEIEVACDPHGLLHPRIDPGPGRRVAVVVVVQLPGQRQLPKVVHALNALRFRLGLAQRRQEHARENGNDGDNDQQFDEGESGAGWP